MTKLHIMRDDPRREKRFFSKNGMTDPVYIAYTEGMALGHYGPKSMPPCLRSNPYPAGLRHDAWQTGYEQERDSR